MKKIGTYNTRLVRFENDMGQSVVMFKTVTYNSDGKPITWGDVLAFDDKDIPFMLIEVGAAAAHPVVNFPGDFVDDDGDEEFYDYVA